MIFALSSLVLFFGCAHKATPKEQPGFDALLSQYTYPFPVGRFEFDIQGQKVSMAYMDLKSEGTPKGTIVLLHGKNFSGFYFEKIARDLVAQNYRVIIPDQIGFGKSSKPEGIQFSFHLLAKSTLSLLKHLDSGPVVLMGHSMGGMIATRIALMDPSQIQKLILVNPIGLEDYKLFASYKTIDELYAMELQTDAQKIKQYQLEAYYGGQWKPEYDPLLVPAIGWTKHPDFPLIAKIAAQTTDMVYTQPVVYEFKDLKVPTVLILGQRDRTAPGKGWATPENKKKMGDYPSLGKKVQKMIPGSKLVQMAGFGHVPFIEDHDLFMKALNDNLKVKK